MVHRHSLLVRWAIGAFMLGLLFPVASLVVAAISSDEDFLSDTFASQPALWVVALAPIVLAVVGGVIGGAHSQLKRLQEQTADLAERVAHEWTAEIHETNVAVATTASLRAQFFAALSHDMRVPLSAILGFTSLANDDSVVLDRESLVTFMIDIGQCANQLLEIVNDLMDATKLEAGRIELELDDVVGDDIAAKVVAHLQPLAEEEHLDLELELEAGVPVRADTQRFRQILINLVSNALKYTETGTVTVRSYATQDEVVYEVQDTGSGISPADMPKVFTAFEQTDVAKGRLDSTGLGLPVSLGMAQAMGGTIEAESLGVGHGSSFRLKLAPGTGTGVELTTATLPGLVAA